MNGMMGGMGMPLYNPAAYQLYVQMMQQQMQQMQQGMTQGMNQPTAASTMPVQPAQTSTVDLYRVDGMEGAKRFEMPQNSRVALFDGNEDILIIKATDGTGFPSYRRARLDWIDENEEKAKVDYVPRGEFEDTRKELEELRKKVDQYAQQSVSNQRGKSSSGSDGK